MDQERLAEQVPQEGLDPADAAALDALVEAGMDVRAASAGPGVDSERVGRLGALLALLECGASPNDSLADVTLVRVMQTREKTQASSRSRVMAEPLLCSDDQEALDAWVMEGYDAARVPGALRERARRHQRIAELVAGSAAIARSGGRWNASPEDTELLVDRTLAAVQADIDKRAEGMVLLETARPRRSSLRLADIMSVAAVLLIGSAVLFPVMTAVREQGRRTVCSNNLHATAMGMSSYAATYADSLPIATASLGKGRWWDVGRPQHSNSANLYTLARTGYAELETLACPGNRAAPTAMLQPDAKDWRRLSEVSYSYQILFGPQRPAWNHGARIVILADRSPVVPRAVRGEMIDPFANALNHGGAGQHVLFNDGAAVWMRTPVLENGDNIWLPRAIEVQIEQMSGRGSIRPLSGTELPTAVDDVFLGP